MGQGVLVSGRAPLPLAQRLLGTPAASSHSLGRAALRAGTLLRRLLALIASLIWPLICTNTSGKDWLYEKIACRIAAGGWEDCWCSGNFWNQNSGRAPTTVVT